MLNQKDYARHNYNQQMMSSMDCYPLKEHSYRELDEQSTKKIYYARTPVVEPSRSVSQVYLNHYDDVLARRVIRVEQAVKHR